MAILVTVIQCVSMYMERFYALYSKGTIILSKSFVLSGIHGTELRQFTLLQGYLMV